MACLVRSPNIPSAGPGLNPSAHRPICICSRCARWRPSDFSVASGRCRESCSVGRLHRTAQELGYFGVGRVSLRQIQWCQAKGIGSMQIGTYFNKTLDNPRIQRIRCCIVQGSPSSQQSRSDRHPIRTARGWPLQHRSLCLDDLANEQSTHCSSQSN